MKQKSSKSSVNKSAETSSKQIDLKDKYEDGEMDLSMCDLQDVPVKSISTFKKMYSLDLSSNHIVTLPKNFVSLTNLTKLDLSKNQLKELPENFGELTKLKHLDLYKNELQHLPLTFSKLKALKWLDLKDNPLMPKIAQIAGPCLDSKQCQSCAKDIVLFYTRLEETIQEEKEMREKHRQKSLMEKEANAQKKKQQEKKNKKKQKQQEKGAAESKPNLNGVPKKTEIKLKRVEKPVKPSNICFKFILYFFTLLVFASVALFVATSLEISQVKIVESYVKKAWKSGVSHLPPELTGFANKSETYFSYVHNVTGRELTKIINRFLTE